MITLTSTFTKEDAPRIEATVDRLLPHLIPGEFLFVGGLAIRYHAALAGLPYPDRPFNDLDLIVKQPNSLNPAICGTFLVGHYHPPTYWALVEPGSRIKVDVFGWRQAEKTTQAPYKNYHLPIASAESQLAKTILDTRKVLEGRKIDPKQFADASLLLQIANHDEADRYLAHTGLDLTAETAFSEAQIAATNHPELVVAYPFRKAAGYVCAECVETPDFPLTPLETITQIMVRT